MPTLVLKVHPHMLRHACGFALANAGHDTCALQAYLGHRNIQHTVRYTELAPNRRLPTLVWPRELPIDGVPEDVVAIVDENARWLAANDGLPKLFIRGSPGAIQTGRLLELLRAFPNQWEVAVKGLHHLQDDSPKEIGEALRVFVLGKSI